MINFLAEARRRLPETRAAILASLIFIQYTTRGNVFIYSTIQQSQSVRRDKGGVTHTNYKTTIPIRLTTVYSVSLCGGTLYTIYKQAI